MRCFISGKNHQHGKLNLFCWKGFARPGAFIVLNQEHWPKRDIQPLAEAAEGFVVVQANVTETVSGVSRAVGQEIFIMKQDDKSFSYREKVRKDTTSKKSRLVLSISQKRSQRDYVLNFFITPSLSFSH